MLTPEQLSNIPDSIADLFSELETFIITDISRRLKKTGQITSSAQWQMQQAQLMGIKNIEAKIVEMLNLSQNQIEDIFPNVAATSMNSENEIYKTAGYKTISLEDSKMLKDYLKSAIKTTKGDIENITQSLGFAEVQNGKVVYSSVSKFYQKELNIAHAKIMTGVQDYSTAIKQSVRKLAESGLRYVDYNSGYSINVDSAARRSVLTSVHQMNQEMTNYIMDEIVPSDEQYAETTAHANARPSHQVWQGRVFKVNGSTTEYENLVRATGLGTARGLMGVNCRHSYFTFIPGVSQRAYTDKQLKNINTPNFIYKDKEYSGYEATQYQRQIENEIRKTKREILAYKESGLNDDLKVANANLKALRKEYKEFSEVAGISAKNNRIQI